MDNIKAFFKNHPVIFMAVYTVAYFFLFLLLEASVKPRFIINCFIDDLIPFCEYFIIPYLMWFMVIPSILFLLMRNDRTAFWSMVKMMFTGNLICLLLYALFPNGVPAKNPVAEENIFCFLVNTLYYNDTPTNVCPSIHVLDTLAAHIAIIRSEVFGKSLPVKASSGIFLLLVSIATVTLKQHSIIDAICSLLLILVLEKLVYGNSSLHSSKVYLPQN